MVWCFAVSGVSLRGLSQGFFRGFPLVFLPDFSFLISFSPFSLVLHPGSSSWFSSLWFFILVLFLVFILVLLFEKRGFLSWCSFLVGSVVFLNSCKPSWFVRILFRLLFFLCVLCVSMCMSYLSMCISHVHAYMSMCMCLSVCISCVCLLLCVYLMCIRMCGVTCG